MPKGIQKVQFSFEDQGFSHYGGMWLIQRFCKKLGLKKHLQDHIRLQQRNNDYNVSELILALLYSVIMGLKRINKTEILQYNGAFLLMLGLSKFPDQSTLRRFLARLLPRDIRQIVRLHDSLRAQLFSLPRRRHSLTFDIDSIVVVLYGKQENARIGYNPKKPGRRSYHPIVCFESHFQEFWHGSLRPGNAASSTGIIGFLKTCLAKIPSGIAMSRVRFRMDSGFYSQLVAGFLDDLGCVYVIVAKEYPTVRARARACRFQALQNGWEAGEFHAPIRQSSTGLHRFVVVRRPIPEDPLEAKQLKLFQDKKYIYHIFVTNLTTTPWRVYLFYNPRATIEKNNRELLYDYPLAKIPSASWTSNVAFFQLILVAVNIVHWFKRLCLPPEYWTSTLDTIRTDFLILPTQIVRSHKVNIVKLPRDYPYREEFLSAFTRASRLKLPEKFRFCKPPRK
jgi:hypothetical protein